MLSQELIAQIHAGEDHFLAGRFEEALDCFEHVLTEVPDCPEALNDAGLAYAKLGQVVCAVQSFEEALSARPENEPAFFNMLDLLLKEDAEDLAREAFGKYAKGIRETEEKAKYREVLVDGYAQGDGAPVSSVEVAPPFPPSGTKVAFVCGPDQKFITDIEREVGRRHPVKVLHFSDGKVDLQAIQEVLDWADVTWFEWCDPILVHASQRLRKSGRVICRLHRYESFTELPAGVNWDFVDTLVLVAPQILDVLRATVPGIEERVEVKVVYNGVDLNHFTLQEHRPGFELAYIGYINHRKNPSLLLQCLAALVQQDPRYRLHIAGVHQQADYKLYFEHMVRAMGLEAHVILHGWQSDVRRWLADKDYLLSTSVHESFGYNIAEAMACGIKPVIHNFPGADQLYPEAYLFNTVAECVDRVRDGRYEPAAYRRLVEARYSLAGQMQAIEALLEAPALAGLVA